MNPCDENLQHRPIICVVGARPNFIKMAPVLKALTEHTIKVPVLLVHTGQHYDTEMSEQLFQDLELPTPDIHLAVGSGSHAIQTAEVMRKFEPVVDNSTPCCVVVVGDVNSTLACSLVAVKKNVPVVHVEAGLRSWDRSMPEEINRVLTDQISSRLYVTERSALSNLSGEGVPPDRVSFCGNVMIDALHQNRLRAISPKKTLLENGKDPAVFFRKTGYGLVTMHRPSNVDDERRLSDLLDIFAQIAERVPLIFALHPRTRVNIDRFGLHQSIDKTTIALLPAQGYLEMLGLMAEAKMVLTDSGGIQEETTALGIPCLTLRENTERPITIDEGTNTLVGTSAKLISKEVEAILEGRAKSGRVPELWDGYASKRIADDLLRWLHSTR